MLNWLDFDVSQGSLLAYFFNSHRRFGGAAATSLETIGATSMASVLRTAPTLVVDSADEWNEQRREIQQQGEFAVAYPYRGLGDADALAAVTGEYSRAADDDWGRRLDEWLADTVAQLARK